MEPWTVDRWSVREGAEQEFVDLLRSRSVGGTRVFHDLERLRVYWFPRRWESRQEMLEWHRAFVRATKHLIEDHETNIMELVEA